MSNDLPRSRPGYVSRSTKRSFVRSPRALLRADKRVTEHLGQAAVRLVGKGCHARERDGKVVGDLGRGELSGVLQAEEFAVLI